MQILFGLVRQSGEGRLRDKLKECRRLQKERHVLKTKCFESDSPRINPQLTLTWYLYFYFIKESRQHLFPTMFARLYLMKALQQVSSFQYQTVILFYYPCQLPLTLNLS